MSSSVLIEAAEAEGLGGQVIDGSAFPADEQQLRQLLTHGDFTELATQIVAAGVADTRFVIDQLAGLDAGRPVAGTPAGEVCRE
jgi:hypothetical protein